MSEVLRLATAGNVDDGKSTLIGRLLFDSKTICDDQLATVERTSRERGDPGPDLALLTDGLRAEREQGITIDVAHRYFTTPKRKFIIADTPGHVQYTRNMVTGASTADVALILVDAVKGVLEQSRRHAFIASLLGVPHLVVCVNKMDLVDWSRARFEQLRQSFGEFAARLDLHDLAFVPMSALHGDNVVQRSLAMPWYEGTPLLRMLEDVHIASDRNLIDARFPVQYVQRPRKGGDGRRSYAGTVASGVFAPGDEVLVLPSGRTTTVRAIHGPGGSPLTQAISTQAVTMQLADELDISRGHMVCRSGNRPQVNRDIDAMVCWLTEHATLTPGATYRLQHGTHCTRATVDGLRYRLDVNTLHRDPKREVLALNDIGRVTIRTQEPLMFDPYRRNRETGSFILIDETTNNTVAAGMINGPASDISWHHPVAQRDRRGLTVWLTGLSGSGKSTIAYELERRLLAEGRPAYVLDGDNLRHGLNAGLGFTPADRTENVRRVGEVAKLFADAGFVAIVSLISPYRADRARARDTHAAADLPFVEVFVDTPLDECRTRDPKGLYAKASTGDLNDFTGLDAPYEPPPAPDVVLHPSDGDAASLAAKLHAALEG